MKRISMFAVILLVLAASICQGRPWCSSRYRTRWSVYKHGLVSGDVYYNPYAYEYGRTGLVSGNVRYSPYAFDYEHSGLIYEPYCAGGFNYLFVRHYDVDREPYDAVRELKWPSSKYSAKASSGAKVCSKNRVKSCPSNLSSLTSGRISAARSIRSEDLKKDGDIVISQYLKGKNIEFKPDNYLRVDGRTVSATFLLKDKDVIIKYWDPELIDQLESKEEYKKINYVQYLNKWNEFWCKYQQAGGKVCQIISSDRNRIIADLEHSSELIGG